MCERLKQNCFISVLFQFYFSFISHVRAALNTLTLHIHAHYDRGI